MARRRTIVEASLLVTGPETLGMVREKRSARCFTAYKRDVQVGFTTERMV